MQEDKVQHVFLVGDDGIISTAVIRNRERLGSMSCGRLIKNN